MRSDSDVKRDVEEELRWNPEVDATDITVAVKDGVVTLAGFVRNYGDKWLAESAAKHVAGVAGVANDIEVRLLKADEWPDSEVAREAVEAVRNRLPRALERIALIVRDGWVTLEGEVEWNYQRDLAESAVRWTKGVKGINNLIRVNPKVPPTEIKRTIEEALRRNAEVDADSIEIEVIGSEVILNGTVRSTVEREEAERVAWSAPGVTHVDDRIVMRR